MNRPLAICCAIALALSSQANAATTLWSSVPTFDSVGLGDYWFNRPSDELPNSNGTQTDIVFSIFNIAADTQVESFRVAAVNTNINAGRGVKVVVSIAGVDDLPSGSPLFEGSASFENPFIIDRNGAFGGNAGVFTVNTPDFNLSAGRFTVAFVGSDVSVSARLNLSMFTGASQSTQITTFIGNGNTTIERLTDPVRGVAFEVLGTPNAVDAIPEPSSWVMLIAGFGLTGTAMRRRRRAVAI